ncbi:MULTISPECIES: hypothetical protein [unclassified Pseudomonas]|uniref:hypothetical protein n=1 Tax=unclassified Pseudomonas TaxID=196821 RepID=UPI001B31FB2B|nr:MULTISPECIES: hypothetical protein [unclassified Pseudomonas]
MTDLWRAEQWLVPRGNILSPASWQAVLGMVFLLTFLTWAWFAFIRPPKYGKRNAERFALTLYRLVVNGAPHELAIIADELARSATALVRYATNTVEIRNKKSGPEDRSNRVPSKVECYATDMLQLIADKRFCRAIVQFAPATALNVFQAMIEEERYGVDVRVFAKNIMNEAIKNTDSFIYHEAEGYESGLIGYHKPFSQTMFSNYRMVETIGTLLDPDIGVKWSATQWAAYCRVVLITLNDFVETRFWGHSFVLYRAMGNIEKSVSDLYRLNGIAQSAWDDDVLKRVWVVVDFIVEAVEILENKGVPQHLQLRTHQEDGPVSRTFYDHLANMIFELVFAASTIKSPWWESWTVQHNSVWGRLFSDLNLTSAAGKIVKHKARRLIYNEVARMSSFPNFKGAKVLGFCLNVMGFTVRKGGYGKTSWPLHKAILAWTQANYLRLHAEYPGVAEDCLVDRMSYDSEKMRVVKTHPVEGLRNEPRYEYLDLTPAPLEVGTLPGSEIGH